MKEPMPEVYYHVCWAAPDGATLRTPTAWPREQVYAVLKGAREIAALCGSSHKYWLEATSERVTHAGWE